MAIRNGGHELAVDCIYTALLQLMDTMPYKDITITDITRRAGVSRMAYYRNYNDKDEILIKRLKAHVQRFAESMEKAESPSEEGILTNFFATLQNDPIIERVVRAGLVDQLLEVHRDMTIQIYDRVFHWDVSDPKNLMVIYQRMGSMIGLILFGIEHNAQVDPNEMALQIMAATAGDFASRRTAAKPGNAQIT